MSVDNFHHLASVDGRLTIACPADALTGTDRDALDPEGLKTHKHRDLVFKIVQQLLSSPLDLRVVKVRAHTGVDGNEAADRLAQEAQEGRTTSATLMRRAALAVGCTGSSTGRSHEMRRMSSCGTSQTSKTIC